MVEKYGETVYRLAFARTRNRTDADDIYQEVFLRYYRSLPHFESDEHEKAWFLRVTLNCANSFLSQRRAAPPSPSPAVHAVPEADPDLSAALDQLPARFREVIHLFYYEGYTAREIAALSDEKESTVRMRLTRARRKLRQLLKEDL